MNRSKLFHLASASNSSFLLHSKAESAVRITQIKKCYSKKVVGIESDRVNPSGLHNNPVGNVNNRSVSCILPPNSMKVRFYSDEKETNSAPSVEPGKFPNFGKMIGVPGPFKMLGNMCSLFYIQHFVDKDVEPKSLSKGFIQALEVATSHRIVRNQFNS